MIVFAAVGVWLIGLAKTELKLSIWWLLAAIAAIALLALFLAGWWRVISVLVLVTLPLLAIFTIQPNAKVDRLANDFATARVQFEVTKDSTRTVGSFGAQTSVAISLDSIKEVHGWTSTHSSGQLFSRLSQAFWAGEKYSATLQFAPSNRATSDFRANLVSVERRISEPHYWQSWVSHLKGKYLNETRGLNDDAKALVTGLAIGNTKGLSPKTKVNLTTVSLTHLVAVSGANCAIAMAAIFFLLGRIIRRRWVRFWFAEVILVAYVYLTEAPSSVVRAAVMASVVMLARTIGRNIRALDSLALAILIIFTIWPNMPNDLGFALSVAATAGLLIVAPELIKQLPQRWPLWIRAAIAVSAAAQLMCTPILLQFQNGLPLYAIVANLLAEPLVAPITILGLLALVLVAPVPWLASILVFCASIGTNYIVGLANYLSSLPEAMVPWMPGMAGMFAATFVVLAVLVWAKLKPGLGRRCLAMSLLAVGSFELATAGVGYVNFVRWPTHDWFIISCDVGQGDATLIRSEGHYALIDVGREPEPVGRCLDRLNIHHLDLLVLTHFDMDHVGGVEGVLRRESIDTALVSSFADSRPGANSCREQLATWGIETIEGGVGVTGQLGDFAWRVISPHLGANEAEDSNDGSVTMIFDSPRVSLLTLADLGEKGQMRLARERATWMPADFFEKPLVLKVSHHGSADQYPEFIESLHANVALISVGLHNGYGHPTKRALGMLRLSGAAVERTDLMGSVAIGFDEKVGRLERSISGATLIGAGR